jgi:hypothetical protein
MYSLVLHSGHMHKDSSLLVIALVIIGGLIFYNLKQIYREVTHKHEEKKPRK